MKQILNWLTSLWTKVFKGYDWLRPRAIAAVNVVNMIKNNVSSVADTIVAITPTKKDDEFLVKAKKAAEKVVTEMAAVEGIIAGNETFETALQDFVTYLEGKTEKARLKFWVELAGQIVVVLSDGRVTINEAIALAQIIYGEIKK